MKYRERYPDDWDSIALEVKEAAGWICQRCGSQCLKPGDDTSELERAERTARTLVVHHLDRVPENSDRSNLIAVCTPCHLDYHRGGLGNVTPGQLSLFD